MGPGRIVLDNRNKQVAAPPPSPEYGLVKFDERRDLLERARAAIHHVPSGIAARLAGSFVTGVFVGGFVYRQGMVYLGTNDRFGSIVLGAIVGSAMFFGYFRLTHRVPSIHDVREFLRCCRLCLVCGYDLTAARVEADGCAVCPECGAAWSLEEKLTDNSATPPVSAD